MKEQRVQGLAETRYKAGMSTEPDKELPSISGGTIEVPGSDLDPDCCNLFQSILDSRIFSTANYSSPCTSAGEKQSEE